MGICAVCGGFTHPDMYAAVAQLISDSRAGMGVVHRHCIGTVMLCHTTSQLFRAQSTLDLPSPWRVGEASSIECRSTNERDSSSGHHDTRGQWVSSSTTPCPRPGSGGCC